MPADWLHRVVNDRSSSYTERAVFKELRKLQEEGILMKIGNRYSIRLPWIHEQRQFFEQMFEHYSHKSHFSTIFADSSPTQIWKFSDIRQLDDFWIQIAFALFETTGKHRMFYWLKHAWFQFLHPHKEAQWQKALQESKYEIFSIVGVDTYLSRQQAASWLKDTFRHSFAPSPFDQLQVGTLTVIDEFIVTVSIPKDLRLAIDSLYSKVSNARDMQRILPVDIFDKKIRCQVKLERNPQRAKKLVSQFTRYFGVKAE